MAQPMKLRELQKLKTSLGIAEVRRKAGSGSSRKYKRFTADERQWLSDHGSEVTANEAAAHLNSSANTVRHKAKAMGITLKYQRNFK